MALCLARWASVASAQETINSASVSGRVTDPQGAMVPGAAVTARQLETNVVAGTTSDLDGRFRFPYLKVGPYEVRVHLDGFKDAARRLTLTVGAAFDVPLTLTVAGLDASVTVTAEAAILEASRSQIAGTVSEREVDMLPMNGRNFLDLALLVPGVSPTNVASTQLFAETSAVPGAGLSIGSQRNFSNNFIVDGLSANDDAAGLSGIPYGVDAVDQFQVVTSGGQAELGRALGGYINVVTKSGTNSPHGELYGYVRDDAFNAPNALTGTALPMHQNQYGGAFGGPIARNRTFYFANVEQRRLDQTGLVTILPASVAAINTRLAAVGYPGSPIATGPYPNPVDTTNVFGKVDHQVNGSDQLSVRYAFYDVASTNSRGSGGLSAPTASAGLDNIDQAVAFSNTISLSARTVNETRAQVAFSDLKAPPTDPVGPAVNIAGVASFGTLSASPTRRVNRLYELVDNLSHQAGTHALRAGIDILYNDDTITYPRSVRGAYTFSSLANFLGGVYNTNGFTQTFGTAAIAQANPNLGVYAQDEWKVGAHVTVNAGLRYDLQFLQTIATDTNNLAPRLGVAWSPSDARRTVVRASAGLFYDRVPLRALANALLSAGNTSDLAKLEQNGISLSPTQAGAPLFPAILSAPIASVTLTNLTTMDRAMQNAHSRQGSVEVEQQLGARSTLSAGYQYTRGVALIIAVNQNVPSCVATGTNNGCRPDPAYGNNSQYSPRAGSSYHGLHASFVQRPAAWGFYRVSYTLSKAMDNVGEFFFSAPIDPFDLSKDWGRSDDDQRHRLVVNGAINSPLTPARTAWERIGHGFQLSGMLQYYSALPLNIMSGVTTIQGTAGRPIVNGAFIDRNAGTGPDFFSLNARVSRTFRVAGPLQVEAMAEAFNLTNRVNVVTVNGNFGAETFPTSPAPTFGQVTAVGDPRSFQFAVRLKF
ncbi:MAG TPA: TonB-dependent receptor [Vicinamibacterales bacterium]|nr:TonB-dependent receptor [Vicinamibacterales bacterium]